MAYKLSNYNGSIVLSDGITQRGNYPLMEAHDILVGEDDLRLDDKLESLSNLDTRVTSLEDKLDGFDGSSGGGTGGSVDTSNLVTKDDIATDFTTNDDSKVLSASAGYRLNNIVNQFKDAVNTVLQCDDAELDQIQEIVNYIKDNKPDVDAILSDKIDKDDIATDLDTYDDSKVLSASAGYKLNEKIAELDTEVNTLDTKVNELDEKVSSTEEAADAKYVAKWNEEDKDYLRVYVNDRGTEGTLKVSTDYPNSSGTGLSTDYTVACKNLRGAITVADPEGEYDAVNKKTLDAYKEEVNQMISEVTPNIDLEALVEQLDKRYAQLSDFEAVFDELHEYAQNIILWGEGN